MLPDLYSIQNQKSIFSVNKESSVASGNSDYNQNDARNLNDRATSQKEEKRRSLIDLFSKYLQHQNDISLMTRYIIVIFHHLF